MTIFSVSAMIGLVLFALVCVTLGTAVVVRLKLTPEPDSAMLVAVIIGSGVLYGSAELLGLAHMFTTTHVRAYTAALAVGALIWLWRDPQLRASLSVVTHRAVALLRRQLMWLILSALGVVMLLIYGPSNYDAIAFHLPRAAAWLQNGSLGHFPTHFVPQLDRPPVAEVQMAWARSLTGTWDSSPLVQWASCVLLALALRACVSRLVGALNRLEETLVMCAVGLSPMIVAQSTTPQVDLAAVAYCTAAAALALDCVHRRSARLAPIAALGFGLALAMKGTAVVGLAAVGIVAAPVLVRRWWSADRRTWILRSIPSARSVAMVVAGGIALVAPLTPTMYRNWSSFGTLAGPEQGSLVVSTNNPKLILANSIRQLGPNLQFGDVGGLDIVLSRAELRVTREISETIGGEMAAISSDINHPSADPWALTTPRVVGYQEDAAASPLVYNLGLAGLVLAMFLWRRWSSRERLAIWATSATMVAAALASGKVVKLQYWVNRLTLPLTVAVLAFGLVATVLLSRRAKLGPAFLSGILVLSVWTWSAADLVGPARPLVTSDYPVAASRWGTTSYDRYFSDRTGIGSDFQALEDFLREQQCTTFAMGSFILYELPLFVVADRVGADVVSVDAPYGGSNRAADAPLPCVIVRESSSSTTVSDLSMPFGYLAVEVMAADGDAG